LDTNKVLALISEVRVAFIKLLEIELLNSSIEGMLPSYGPVLSALFKHNGKLKMKDIAGFANRDKSTVTYLVNNLVKAGYVIKEQGREDYRETYVILTQKAWDAEKIINNISEHLINTAYKDFEEEEKDQLVHLLNKMKKNFGK